MFSCKMRRNTMSRLRFLSVTYVYVRSRQESRALLVLLAFSYGKYLSLQFFASLTHIFLRQGRAERSRQESRALLVLLAFSYGKYLSLPFFASLTHIFLRQGRAERSHQESCMLPLIYIFSTQDVDCNSRYIIFCADLTFRYERGIIFPIKS